MTGPRRRPAPLVGLVTGHLVSLTGNMITFVALPLYVLATTGSAATTGLVGAVATAPVVLGGAFGGVLVDRAGYRRASVLADLVSGATIAAVPLLEHSVGLPLWALLALVFASGLLDTPGQTARSALLPEAALAAGVPIERATGLFEATERASRLLGAPAAGLLVAVLGAVDVLLLDAATFAVSAALVAILAAGLRPDPTGTQPPTRPADPGGAAGYWSDFAAGVRFLAHEPLLRATVLLVMVTNMLDSAKVTVLLPVAADRELGGGAALGLLIGAMGGGALGGSLLFGAVGSRLPRRITFVAAFALAGGPPMLALAAGLPLGVLVAIVIPCGLAAGAINPILTAVELERVPAGMRARVYGVIGAGSWSAMPLGAIGAGYATARFGHAAILTAAAVIYLAVAAVPLSGGVWRAMDRPPHQPGPGDGGSNSNRDRSAREGGAPADGAPADGAGPGAAAAGRPGPAVQAFRACRGSGDARTG